MDTYAKELLIGGAVVVLAGTLSTAYGQTNFTVTSKKDWKRFIIKGNGIETKQVYPSLIQNSMYRGESFEYGGIC